MKKKRHKRRNGLPTDTFEREISNRVERLQEVLRKQNVDGALFVQKIDIYYLSGTDQDAHLWVPANGAALLMVRRSFERAKKDAFLERIVPLGGFSDLPLLLKKYDAPSPARIGLEMDVLPVNHYRIYQKLFPEAELVDISPTIKSLRMIKSPFEISSVCSAAEMGDRMFAQVPTILSEVETETDLALRLEAFYRSQGHPGIVRTRGFNMECFFGHVLSGKNAAVSSNAPGPTGGTGTGPFYSQGAGFGRILPHEPVIVDYTSSVNGYLSDQARTFSLGELPEEMVYAHHVMIEVQEVIIRNAGPGVMTGDLYKKGLDVVKNAKLEKGFMGYPDAVPFVAHGIGLELDEWPIIGKNRGTILEKGMIFALEPKMVFPGKGVVGIENAFVVTSDGLRKLNTFPDTICTC